MSFFSGSQCPPVDGCSTASCNFGALTEEDERISFYSVIFNQSRSVLVCIINFLGHHIHCRCKFQY